MSSLNFGVGLFPTEPLAKMIRLAKLSEDLGYSHVWIGDSHLIWREAFVNMTAIALNTTKVRIGTGVTNPVTRHPSVIASAYATLEEFAPERFIVGIGLGDSSVETMGLRPARLSYFEKAVADMRALFAGNEAELESGKIHLLHPPKRRVPVYVAASGPKMLELAGRIADGIILLVGIDDNYVRSARERIDAGAKAANRDPRHRNRSLGSLYRKGARPRMRSRPTWRVSSNILSRSCSTRENRKFWKKSGRRTTTTSTCSKRPARRRSFRIGWWTSSRLPARGRNAAPRSND